MFGLIPTGLRRKKQIAEGNYVSRSNQPQMKADRHGFKQTEFTIGRLTDLSVNILSTASQGIQPQIFTDVR